MLIMLFILLNKIKIQELQIIQNCKLKFEMKNKKDGMDFFFCFRRETSYHKTPINVCRNIVLSESNEIRGFLPNVSVFIRKESILRYFFFNFIGSGRWRYILQF